MISAIDKIIGFYQIQASAMRILVANTQKAFNKSSPPEQSIANQQEQRLNRFMRDLTPAVSDMLTRFWFQKDHKEKYGESLTDDQIENLEDFTNFVKVLTESVHSLLARCRASSNQSFEQEFEKELKQMEVWVRKKLREFDKALDGTNGRLKSPIDKPLLRVSHK